jgi:hypothetical protein
MSGRDSGDANLIPEIPIDSDQLGAARGTVALAVFGGGLGSRSVPVLVQVAAASSSKAAAIRR